MDNPIIKPEELPEMEECAVVEEVVHELPAFREYERELASMTE